MSRVRRDSYTYTWIKEQIIQMRRETSAVRRALHQNDRKSFLLVAHRMNTLQEVIDRIGPQERARPLKSKP